MLTLLNPRGSELDTEPNKKVRMIILLIKDPIICHHYIYVIFFTESENTPLVESGEKGNRDMETNNDVDMEDGPSRAEGLLRFEVQGFSKLKDTVYSDPVIIRNLQWSVFPICFFVIF